MAIGTGGTTATRFFGREQQLDAVRRALGGPGVLVTLLGPGGAGKTRLLAELTASARIHVPVGGIAHASIQDALDLPSAAIEVAAALGMARGEPESIGAAIASRGPCLIVLDGVERLLPAFADVLQGWRRAAPDARFLVTSQVRLGLPGEVPVSVGPLETAEVARALLLDRVSAVVPGFAADADAEAAADRVAEALDRLPLALELAAARTAVLPLAQLADRLVADPRMSEPRPSGRDLPARHATLAATVSWSWDLLAEEDRQALSRVALMDGSFSVEAAEAVLGAGAIAALARLRDRSLLLVDDGPVPRFRLLRAIRAHARAHLPDAGRQRASEARVAWAAAGAHAAVSHLAGPHPEVGLDWIRDEQIHLRAGVRGPDPASAGACAAALAHRALRHGPVLAGLRALDDARTVGAGGLDVLRAEVLLRLGRLDPADAALDGLHGAEALRLRAEILAARGRIRAARDAAETAFAAASSGTERAAAGLLLARLRWKRGRRAEATELGLEALREAEDAQHALLEATIGAWLGRAAAQDGRVAEAARLLETAAAQLEAQGDRRGRLGALQAQAGLAARDPDVAAGRLDAALALARALGEAGVEASLHLERAGLALMDAPESAHAAALDGLDAARRARRDDLRARAELDLALIAWSRARQTEALAHVDSAERAAQATGDTGTRVEVLALRAALLAEAGKLLAALAAQEAADGLLEATTLTRLPGRVLALRAVLDLAGDDPHAAARRLTEVAAMAPSDLGDVARTGRIACTRLGRILLLLGARVPAEPWLAAWGSTVDAPGRCLVVTPDARFVRPPGGSWTELPPSGQTARLLAALVRTRLRADDAVLDTQAVIDTLWPDEKMGWQSALDRVHQAVRRLRKPLGSSLVERLPDGYRLLVEPALVRL